MRSPKWLSSSLQLWDANRQQGYESRSLWPWEICMAELLQNSGLWKLQEPLMDESLKKPPEDRAQWYNFLVSSGLLYTKIKGSIWSDFLLTLFVMVWQHNLSRNTLHISHFLGHLSFYFVFTTWRHKWESVIFVYCNLDNTERLDAPTSPWETCLHICYSISGTRSVVSEYFIATTYGCWQVHRAELKVSEPWAWTKTLCWQCTFLAREMGRQ